MKTFCTAIISLFISLSVFCQKTDKVILKVGEPMPEFNLGDVRYFGKRQVTNADFFGKWLILDFWNQSCSVCVNAMPKTNSLQKKIGKTGQIILVGYTGTQYHKLQPKPDERSIKKLYKNIRRVSNLTLPAAFDSILFHRLDIGECPYVVVVDTKGIVKAVTTGISYNQVDSLQNGMDVHLKKAFSRTERKQFYIDRKSKLQF